MRKSNQGNTEQLVIRSLSAPGREKKETPSPGSDEYTYLFRPGQTNANGVIICGANDFGDPCQSTLVDPENGRCERHGGKSARGLAHPNYKNGVYQRSGRYQNLPARLLEKYQKAFDDPDYLNNKDELDVLTTLIQDQLEALADHKLSPSEKRTVVQEIEKLIALRAKVTETQLRHEAHRDQHVPYVEVIQTSQRIQGLIRDLAFKHFKDEARPFLTELQEELRTLLYG